MHPDRGSFSHAYDTQVDEDPRVCLYFNNVLTIFLDPPQENVVVPELGVLITHEAYLQLRQYLIDNPNPKTLV